MNYQNEKSLVNIERGLADNKVLNWDNFNIIIKNGGLSCAFKNKITSKFLSSVLMLIRNRKLFTFGCVLRAIVIWPNQITIYCIGVIF